MKTALNILIVFIAVCFARPYAEASTPKTTGKVSRRTITKVDSLMRFGLDKGYYPGATIAVGNHNGILYEACYGWQDAEKSAQVSPEDVYDLASCTKIVSTTLAVMLLYDQDKIEIDDKLGSILPQFALTRIDNITVRELLTHTSGLGNITLYSILFSNPTGKPLISPRPGPEYPRAVDRAAYICDGACPDPLFVSLTPVEGFRRISENCYVNPLVDTLLEGQIVRNFDPKRRGKYLYSDLNFHLLKLVVEKKCGKPLDECVSQAYMDAKMTSTGYHPLIWKPEKNIIPTENDILMQRGLLRGYTHDEIAAVSGNVGGNAGLFSNSTDLSNFCRMMLCGGEFEGKQITSEATVRLFTTAPRALGFNRPEPGNTTNGKPNPLVGGYGHTGYTGTIIWIDPSKDLFMVFLSNRVHPSRTNQGLVNSMLRAKIWEAISTGK